MLIHASQIHDVIIIPVLSNPLNLENVLREKIYRKLNISRIKGTFYLDAIKTIFHNF